ncbi:MAG TPA: ParB/RepB/Spo0J family partition protein [Nitrosomonas sp.]|uniref:ParB/RepB/Spo0J family partition protein n=1 Tax=Nitrosomonas sp. TaxID=42353 RepID=UPI00208405E6|nr:ParB/RepB/Spo0J family partition protein [Nitrosomonas sp.]GJL75794.1 MAG: chromosome partitioning protein ParB [Nitrosomonas sp.]HNP26123.1 ParB/RepB/Spo0J family partition protein [Nitrosomonas sp.]
MVKLKGLGRGLDALLSGNKDSDAAVDRLQDIDISLLQPGKYQPRTNMDQTALAKLADSIKTQGVMQPILVRSVGVDSYEIIAGERRWRAAELAGLAEVPAIIREVADDAALAISLIENIQRENLNPLEEAMGIQRLIDEFGMTHQSASDALGSSRSAVTNLLRLLNLSEPVQELMMQGKIDMGHGRALLALTPAQQIQVGNMIVLKKLSVRETEKMIQHLNKPITKRSPNTDRDILTLQEDVSARLGAQVTIKSRKNGQGNIIIHYVNLDQLDDILRKL